MALVWEGEAARTREQVPFRQAAKGSVERVEEENLSKEIQSLIKIT